MSYSLNGPCGMCIKFDKCVDLAVLSGGIQGIHAIGTGKGHLGSGEVILKCNNFELEPPKEK